MRAALSASNGEWQDGRERAFEIWLGCVEFQLQGRVATPFGSALFMCDNAHAAFEEGVNAADYALQIQAMRGAV